jgi:hypothetical protein
MLACSLAASLLFAATSARAEEPVLLPRRPTSALDQALWLRRPEVVPVMTRAGGTALMIVGSVMVGGGWLLANSGLLVHSVADDPECADGSSSCGMSEQQQVGLGMMVGGAVVCLTGAPLMIYGAAVRQRDTPRRGPSRWGTGSLQPRSPLAFTF